MAQSPHEPTDRDRKTVESMAAYGVPQPDIAAVIGISHPTLRKYYADELATATSRANAKVAEFLYTAASGAALNRGASYADCTRAAMFWLKTRAQWRETERIEHSGPDGGPIQTEDTGARDKLAALIARQSAAGSPGSDTGGAD